MEGALTARDRVGIQDFVLLDETTEEAFINNLKKRFSNDLIYTYIGTLLVSLNPYKELDIYNSKQMDIYMGVNFFELPPHIYALADNAYHTMLTEYNNHFILISGESGAGKTEASKKILQYYAVSCPSTTLLNTVRDKMLMSNPVLEAFGNAKTLKNDNSSRFGKYMDIQFDSQGDAVGGHILNYLLEKSRVVHQNHGERNFHIFYQLVEGAGDELLQQLGLERDCQLYKYLTQGECAIVPSINDKNDWKTVKNALQVVNIDESYNNHLFSIVASVLHLGNLTFSPDSKGLATLRSNSDELQWVSNLLGVDAEKLHEGFTFRKIEAKNDQILSPFTIDHAIYARDALAKAIYGQTFTWLVNRINESMENTDPSRKTVIGLLDIYGFEVFYVNSFEQFCINYCNEKLQQLFIQLTLKAEQEEYEAEGIEWEPVQFFNNKIICDLVEEKHRGIIAILDEECLRPGDATDLTFLERLEDKMANHPHFVTHKLADKMTRKTLERGDFRLLHYAGEVTYCVVGFLDKNNDLLYRNIKDLMCQSKNVIIQKCFSTLDPGNRKRPETVATQFKSSLLKLTEILMAKEAWYIRCLKSNESKQKGQFDEALVRHQVKYLGLMEHLRVRRAGFAYRRKYDIFLQRYKPLCPATWPHWRGDPADGVEVLVQHLGYLPNEYKMGRTKIFIRHPRTLYATEDAFERCKHELATRLQAKYKGYKAKGEFRKQKEAATKIETCWRGVQARKEREKRAWAVKVIKQFIKGYMTRGQAKTTDNSEYLAFVRQNFLNRLKENLPKTVLDKTTWYSPPPVCSETSEILRKLHYRLLVRKYVRGITPQRKAQLQLKLVASTLFKGKKESYPQSIAQPFVDTRINEQDINPRVIQMIRNEHIKYTVPVIKYDRNGFKPRPRQLILTQTAAYVVDDAKIKQRVLYTSLKGISVSSLTDAIVVFHITCEDPKQKGDLVMQCDYLFEFLTKLSVIANKRDAIHVVQGSIKIEVQAGKENGVDFSIGPEPMVYKGKNGHLMVVSIVCLTELCLKSHRD
ncbi:unconventional myosin-Ih isoform X2 [Boleophthalmus pectinirostris]|uniref:unconventional myosin-Ih isoform X2 n=1 Tax=Boleophthalmus pectinirostris TaxID=150288 RepID=UPI00242AD6ED|nr:unconventional myosin-Ih isoform X2 [Boleophthalmus pectinirostris]XP_055017330.1 unconventional myosin-Ih isoform X2 [Boleophthalmus pectinirostris]